MASIAQQLGDFVAGLDATQIPSDVVEKARACLLNSYGMALGGLRLPFAAVACAAAVATHGETLAGVTMLADGRKTSLAGACFANGALFHARAQDDTCGAAHFGTVVIPMLTAMIETDHYPRERFFPSMIAGYEAGGELEQRYGGITTANGYRATAIYGTIAAAASAAHMMALDAEQTTAALSIASSLVGGNLHSATAGTDEWHYQPGFAASSGLTAASLARAGCVASAMGFEGDKGLLRSIAAAAPSEAPQLLCGRAWHIRRAMFKPFPVCAFNQVPVTAALAAREIVRADDMIGLQVHMNPNEASYPGLNVQAPFTSMAATLLSLPFCVGAALLYGVPDMARLVVFGDARLNEFAELIRIVFDPAVPPLSVVLLFTLRGGETRRFETFMNARDFSYDRSTVSALVRRIGGEEGVPTAAYDAVQSFVDRMPNADIRELLGAFTAPHH
jgi:2-methylcitrate dehydratase PrpD